MTVVIFAGPTLAARDGGAELDAIYLPPASQGDVYRVARDRPDAIGIVDGYFECMPAVWHKEILWAMSQGIHVYGSGSMGALRAAELAKFGMVGVGWVFEAFRDGVLEDDDEVTVAHAAEDLDYRPLSEAMVNIRRTLAAATREGILDARTSDALLMAIKATYYPERHYATLLKHALDLDVPATEIERLRAWLPTGRINQKRDDALAMLRAIRDHLQRDGSPKTVAFAFEHTVWWDHATSFAGTTSMPTPPSSPGGTTAGTLLLEALLDELRLRPGCYRQAHNGAALDVLLLREAERARMGATQDAIAQTTALFRAAFGLETDEAFDTWLAANDLPAHRFAEMMKAETLRASARIAIDREVIARVADHLRTIGQYADLAARAREKKRRLAAQGFDNASLDDLGLTEDALLQWHQARTGETMPDDATRAAHESGFDGLDAFRLALIRERSFVQVTEPERSSDAPAPMVQR
jgi:hypothetical protein